MFLLSVLLLLEKNIKLAIVDLSESILIYIVLSNSLWTYCALTILICESLSFGCRHF